MSQAFAPLFAPENAAAVGAWGFIIGAASAVLGIIGFGVTLYQVWKVKAAAQASNEAISNLRVRLSHLDLVQECARAESALHSIKEHLLNSATEVPLNIFDSLALSLVTINESPQTLPEHTRARLASAIESINKLSTAPKNGGRTVTAKQMATVREYYGLLVSIRTHIQEGQAA